MGVASALSFPAPPFNPVVGQFELPSFRFNNYTRMVRLQRGMNISLQLFGEINSCDYLFLRDITEPEGNSLRLLIEEASANPESASIEVAGTRISDLHRVESSEQSRLFEFLWHNYISYSVRNESYVTSDDSGEKVLGRLLRVYSKSHFLDYVSRATFATAEHPGPFQHFQLICQLHIIDVVSTDAPQIRRVRPV